MSLLEQDSYAGSKVRMLSYPVAQAYNLIGMLQPAVLMPKVFLFSSKTVSLKYDFYYQESHAISFILDSACKPTSMKTLYRKKIN
jgi:hypothetical protein